MPMKYSEDLPQDEKQHFTKCSCGHYFDMRDLADVIRHMHEYEGTSPEIPFSHSRKCGEPLVYRKGGRIYLN